MNFYVLTLFCEMIDEMSNHSIIKRAVSKGIVNIEAIDIRKFSNDRHGHVDDYPYGGGSGMVMKAQPIYDSYIDLIERKNLPDDTRVIYVTPQGDKLDQRKVESLSKEENLVILCGHYEGVDERVIESIVTDQISIGDYVLTGGELPALVLMDSISRLVSGVLNKESSFLEETFSDGLLEYPQYTRPEVFQEKQVPEVLLSGHHAKIEKWRKEQSIERTKRKRPDLYEKYMDKEN